MLIEPFPEFEYIRAISIPLPEVSDLITANLYAVGKGPVTLIDTGLKSPGTLEYIQSELVKADLDMADVQRILITHSHMDHFGLAAKIRETVKHPVECFIHAQDEWQISSEHFLKEMWSEEAENLMAMAGMPREEMDKMRKRFSTSSSWAILWTGFPFCEGETNSAVTATTSRSSTHPVTRRAVVAFMNPGTRCCLAETRSSSTSRPIPWW